MSDQISGKLYRHYKGGLYVMLKMVANHSETKEAMVVYYNLEHKQLWVRPYKMFFERIDHEGKNVPRFCPVSGSGNITVEV